MLMLKYNACKDQDFHSSGRKQQSHADGFQKEILIEELQIVLSFVNEKQSNELFCS